VIAGCSRSSLMNWNRNYFKLGIAGLIDKRVGGNFAKLEPRQIKQLQEQYTLVQLFGSNSFSGQFWSVPDLAYLLERDYGVVYKSATSYRSLLKRCGLSRQKPATQYKSRSEFKVMAFEEN